MVGGVKNIDLLWLSILYLSYHVNFLFFFKLHPMNGRWMEHSVHFCLLQQADRGVRTAASRKEAALFAVAHLTSTLVTLSPHRDACQWHFISCLHATNTPSASPLFVCSILLPTSVLSCRLLSLRIVSVLFFCLFLTLMASAYFFFPCQRSSSSSFLLFSLNTSWPFLSVFCLKSSLLLIPPFPFLSPSSD